MRHGARRHPPPPPSGLSLLGLAPCVMGCDCFFFPREQQVNFFMGKERLLQPADFSAFARPSLLITAAPTSDQPPKARMALGFVAPPRPSDRLTHSESTPASCWALSETHAACPSPCLSSRKGTGRPSSATLWCGRSGLAGACCCRAALEGGHWSSCFSSPATGGSGGSTCALSPSSPPLLHHCEVSSPPDRSRTAVGLQGSGALCVCSRRVTLHVAGLPDCPAEQRGGHCHRGGQVEPRVDDGRRARSAAAAACDVASLRPAAAPPRAITPVARSLPIPHRHAPSSLPAAIAEDFQRTRENPFHLGRRVRVCQSMDDLERMGPGPKVILASLDSLEGGPSRELLLKFSKEATSSIVMTDRSAARGEVAAWLLQHAGSHPGQRPQLPLTLAKHVPLRGAKLEGACARGLACCPPSPAPTLPLHQAKLCGVVRFRGREPNAPLRVPSAATPQRGRRRRGLKGLRRRRRPRRPSPGLRVRAHPSTHLPSPDGRRRHA